MKPKRPKNAALSPEAGLSQWRAIIKLSIRMHGVWRCTCLDPARTAEGFFRHGVHTHPYLVMIRSPSHNNKVVRSHFATMAVVVVVVIEVGLEAGWEQIDDVMHAMLEQRKLCCLIDCDGVDIPRFRQVCRTRRSGWLTRNHLLLKVSTSKLTGGLDTK
ncbi:hypothetical protein BJ878DRAFT_2035 [Calycina marina]|uniref:Uncharacterized protein n=1 Tax=Calycina marina TaxID=1763456 RepID=A0A9P7ZC89_9HELO|nr:hypothetical protein BJ878DRAFT_2035 [Calycina marina]